MVAKLRSGHAWAAMFLLGFAGCGEVFKGSENEGGEAGAGVEPETGGAGGARGGMAGASGSSGTSSGDAGTSGTSGAGTGAVAGQGGNAGASAGTAGVGGAGNAANEGGVANTGESGAGGANEAGSDNEGGVSGSGGEGGVETGPVPVVLDGLVLWLRTDVGLTVENDGTVSHWTDQSANAFHVEQTGAEQRPKLVNSGGSLASVEFDGVDDYMRIPEGFADFQAGFSAFVVTSTPSLEACWAVLEFSNGREVDDIFLGQYAQSVHYEVLDVWMTQGEYPAGENLVLAVIHRPNQVVETRTNGSIAGENSFALPALVSRGQNFLGRSLYENCGVLEGTISEVLVYDRAVTSVELLAIEAYLATRFGCCSG
jgi:hypothetical protein